MSPLGWAEDPLCLPRRRIELESAVPRVSPRRGPFSTAAVPPLPDESRRFSVSPFSEERTDPRAGLPLCVDPLDLCTSPYDPPTPASARCRPPHRFTQPRPTRSLLSATSLVSDSQSGVGRMQGQPSTPSTGKGSGALGRFLNKLRTPSSGETPPGAASSSPHEGGSRSSSPFGSLMGRRSSSRASIRTFDSAHSSTSARPPPPPFPASLNASSTSLASANSPRYASSFSLDDDPDLELPSFHAPTSGPYSFGGSPANSSTDLTALPPPPQPLPPMSRPGTSMSVRSRTESATKGADWKSSLSSATGRTSSRVPLSSENGAPSGQDDDELTHKVPPKPSEVSSPASSCAHTGLTLRPAAHPSSTPHPPTIKRRISFAIPPRLDVDDAWIGPRRLVQVCNIRLDDGPLDQRPSFLQRALDRNIGSGREG